MKISKRESVLLTILIVTVIVAFGTKWLVMPAYANWAEKIEQVKRLDSLQHSTLQNPNDEHLPEVYDSALSVFFMPETTPENIHRYLQKYVQKSGLILDDISISQVESALPRGFSLISANLAMSGTQTQAIDFISQIESQHKSIALQSMRLTPAKDGKVNFVVNFHIYCMKDATGEDFDYIIQNPEPSKGFIFSEAIGTQSGDRSEG